MDDVELKKGRIAVWLDPNDIKFLANEWRRIPETIAASDKETWARIAFRLMSALNKSGVEYKPKFPNEDEKYHLNKF